MQTEIKITEDQLAIDWTLTDNDIQFISKNSNHSIKFATQLCYLRAHWRFIGKDDVVPFTPLSYIAKQLGQQLSVTPVFEKNSHTYIQQEKIRNYLGYCSFNAEESLKLEAWLVDQLRKETMDKKQLIDMAIGHLKTRRIVLPPSITLSRLVSQKVNEAIEGFHRSIAESLAPDKRKLLHQLITPEHKEAYAQLAELRTSPQNANSDVMNQYLFHPRLKDLAEQNIYKVDGSISYGDLDDVFSGTINIELIRENWDQIVRIVASLKNGLAPAHVIIQKLANRTDSVSRAIREFGCIIKSIYCATLRTKIFVRKFICTSIMANQDISWQKSYFF